jgi:SAM-dependent methyltransferase
VSTPAVNTRAWWEDYFQHHWVANDGPNQTRYFMARLVEHLPAAERQFLDGPGRRILDWGCALGDGVDVLAQAFPHAAVSGLDFALTAIREARARFPRYGFLRVEDDGIPEVFDAIISSNCLEHFDRPLERVRAQLPACRYLYAALVPFGEQPLMECHCVRFDEASFPDEIDGFGCLVRRVFATEPRFWAGYQMLVLYGSPAYCAGAMGGNTAGRTTSGAPDRVRKPEPRERETG